MPFATGRNLQAKCLWARDSMRMKRWIGDETNGSLVRKEAIHSSSVEPGSNEGGEEQNGRRVDDGEKEAGKSGQLQRDSYVSNLSTLPCLGFTPTLPALINTKGRKRIALKLFRRPVACTWRVCVGRAAMQLSSGRLGFSTGFNMLTRWARWHGLSFPVAVVDLSPIPSLHTRCDRIKETGRLFASCAKGKVIRMSHQVYVSGRAITRRSSDLGYSIKEAVYKAEWHRRAVPMLHAGQTRLARIMCQWQRGTSRTAPYRRKAVIGNSSDVSSHDSLHKSLDRSWAIPGRSSGPVDWRGWRLPVIRCH
jgi:hypothetical protein